MGPSAGWATPFGVQVSESRYDLAFSEFVEQSPDGTPENVAAQAMQLMLDGDSDGLIELASDDSSEGLVKLYAGLGKKFVDEPVVPQRLNIADHSCIIFLNGNVTDQGAVIPLRRIENTYQLFFSSQIESLQQFLFQVTNGLLRYPEAATAIAESRIQIRLRYKQRDPQQAVSIFATDFAGVGKDGMLILPENFSGSEESLMRVLDYHWQLWETLNEQGSEAAGEKVHPDGRASFVRESDELAANGYPLDVKWIAWTEDV